MEHHVPHALLEDDNDPPHLCCPITHMLMEDPVIADDGHTYEHRAISMWLRQHSSSPLTNVILKDKILRPNYALKGAIQEWLRGREQKRLTEKDLELAIKLR